ncbi:MAG: hypothetical protein ABTQ34_00015 [Bdellovibrionales bacterium]
MKKNFLSAVAVAASLAFAPVGARGGGVPEDVLREVVDYAREIVANGLQRPVAVGNSHDFVCSVRSPEATIVFGMNEIVAPHGTVDKRVGAAVECATYSAEAIRVSKRDADKPTSFVVEVTACRPQGSRGNEGAVTTLARGYEIKM